MGSAARPGIVDAVAGAGPADCWLAGTHATVVVLNARKITRVVVEFTALRIAVIAHPPNITVSAGRVEKNGGVKGVSEVANTCSQSP